MDLTLTGKPHGAAHDLLIDLDARGSEDVLFAVLPERSRTKLVPIDPLRYCDERDGRPDGNIRQHEYACLRRVGIDPAHRVGGLKHFVVVSTHRCPCGIDEQHAHGSPSTARGAEGNVDKPLDDDAILHRSENAFSEPFGLGIIRADSPTYDRRRYCLVHVRSGRVGCPD